MRSYSQNGEDLIVQQLFGSFKGQLLSIGENDGSTFSNARLLIELGFKAHLVEPSSTFAELQLLHKDNPNVICYNIGIGERDEIVAFYESGAHVPAGDDQALVSSVNYDETIRWRKSGVQFEEKKVQLLSWTSFLSSTFVKQFDFISIDVEGLEWSILQQIDLDAAGCKVLCIEYNGDRELFKKFSEYCRGFRLVDRNNENLIFSRI